MYRTPRTLRSLKEISKQISIHQQTSNLVHLSKVVYSTEPKNIWKIIDKEIKKNVPTDFTEHCDDLIKTLKLEFDTETDQLNSNTVVLDYMIDSVNRSENVRSLLNAIEPFLNQIKSTHLEYIYNRFHDLCKDHLRRSLKSTGNRNQIEDLSDLIDRTSSFQSLLNYTEIYSEELSVKCMLNAIQVFDLVKLSPQNETFEIIFNNLLSIIRKLNLKQLHGLLASLRKHPNQNDRTALSKIFEAGLKSAKLQILDRQLAAEDVKLITGYFSLFLFSDDYETAHQLNKLLLSSRVHLDPERSTDLLRNIKIKNIRLKEANVDWPERLILKGLLEKCNSTIIESLKSEITKRQVKHYLVRLHDLRDDYSLRNLYDPNLLDHLTPTLINNEIILNSPSTRLCVYNLCHNYSLVNFHNEELYKFVYNLMLMDRSMYTKTKIDLFFTLTELKLPFVDWQRLVEFVFDNLDSKELNSYLPNQLLDFLCRCILADVNDQRLIDCFDLSDKVDDELDFSLNQIRYLNLADVHSSMSTTKDELKGEFQRNFKQLASKISINNLLRIEKGYHTFNSKLKENAHLSNGLHLNVIAIYDREMNDLISLSKFENYFDQVDKMPLNENQQV